MESSIIDRILHIVVFDVGAAQSILVYPPGQKNHARLIDCGSDKDGFSPVDVLMSGNLLPKGDNGKPSLGNLTITNYDNDHFSYLPELREKVDIWTACLPGNISSEELKEHKDETTDALEHLCNMKDKYTISATDFKPIYNTYIYHLEQSDLDGDINTNHLSQIVFIEYGGSTLCVAGDLEKPAWEKILKKENVKKHLKNTNVMIAPHHGRENGYHEEIFCYCNPDLIIISDKDIIHDTQGGMAQKYLGHVKGDGVLFKEIIRKVLTTRSDGHIIITFKPNGVRSYQSWK